MNYFLLRDKNDKTAGEFQPSICDDCDKPATVWVHDDSTGDERLLCNKHRAFYKDWRIEKI